MADEQKTREELLAELSRLRNLLAESGRPEAGGEGDALGFGIQDYEVIDILNGISEHVVIHAPGLKMIWCNKAAADSLGLDPAKMRGKRCHELWGQRSEPCENCPVVKSFQTGRPHEAEQKTPDGRTWSVRSYPVKDDAGSVVATIEVTLETTERTRAESRLRLLSTAIEQSSEGVAIATMDRRVQFSNRTFAEMLGYDTDDLVGKYINELYPPDEEEAVREAAKQVRETGWFAGEIRHAHRDGSAVCTFMNVTLFRDENGNPAGLVAATRDVTEERKKEAALRESEARYRAVVEDQTELICRFRPDSTLTFVNEAYCRYFGKPREELVGARFLELIPESDRDFIKSQIASLDPQRPALTHEHRVITPGGEVRWQQWTNRILIGEDGETTELQAVGRDVTERRRAEEALRESERLYRTLFDNMPLGIGITDVNGEPIAYNDEMLRMGGYTRETVSEIQNVSELYYTPARRDEILETAHTQGFVDRAEVKFRRRDGAPFDALLSMRPVHVSGRPCWQVLVEDVTEQKRMEQQLRQSQKMESIGRLAGGIAHDFNNLLTAIMGYAEAAHDELQQDSNVQEYIGEVLTAANRAADLTIQLLAFSSRQIISPRIVNLNNSIMAMDKMLRRLLGEDVEFVTVLEPKLGNIKADPGQVEQLVLNLVVNARDAMPEGGSITLKTANVELDEEFVRINAPEIPSGDYVMLTVSDTGCGMSEDVRAQIFEPFFSTKSDGKGSGLGLATCYGIVKQSRGHIGAYSRPGCGATLRVYLPRCAQAAEEDAREELDELPTGKETILLAENEPSVRTSISRILRQFGYDVIEAENGKDALRIVSQAPDRKIDLLLTDVVMPHVGGKELAGKLADILPEMKVLFTSGYADDRIAESGVLEEGVDFLQKPFSSAQLAVKVRQVLDK